MTLPAPRSAWAAETDPRASAVNRATGIWPACRSTQPAAPLNSDALARKCGIRPLSNTSRAQAIGSSTDTRLATTRPAPVGGSLTPYRYRCRKRSESSEDTLTRQFHMRIGIGGHVHPLVGRVVFATGLAS